MSAIQEVEKLLAAMSRSEKAQLLQWVVRDLGDAFPGIETNPGVSGGRALRRSDEDPSLAIGASAKTRDQ